VGVAGEPDSALGDAQRDAAHGVGGYGGMIRPTPTTTAWGGLIRRRLGRSGKASGHVLSLLGADQGGRSLLFPARGGLALRAMGERSSGSSAPHR